MGRYRIMPVPDADHLIAQLASDDTERVKRDIERHVEEQLHGAVGDLYRRFGEAIERISERLREDDDGKPLVFRNTMIANIFPVTTTTMPGGESDGLGVDRNGGNRGARLAAEQGAVASERGEAVARARLDTLYPFTPNRAKFAIARDSSLLCYSFSRTANYHRIHRGTCSKPGKHSYCVCHFVLGLFWYLVLEHTV